MVDLKDHVIINMKNIHIMVPPVMEQTIIIYIYADMSMEYSYIYIYQLSF